MTFNIDILLNTAEPDMFKVIYDMLIISHNSDQLVRVLMFNVIL